MYSQQTWSSSEGIEGDITGLFLALLVSALVLSVYIKTQTKQKKRRKIPINTTDLKSKCIIQLANLIPKYAQI